MAGRVPYDDFADIYDAWCESAPITLENRGYGTLRVQVLPSEPWLTVNRQEWTIKARKRARVRVQIVDAPGEAQASITIRTPDQDRYLPVQCIS